MDFASIVLYLAVFYIKPQEWSELFRQVRFVQLTLFVSVVSLFLREQSVKAADLLKTPHDWAMLGFFTWVVIASPTPLATFQEFLNRLVIYLVIVQTLNSWDRIRRFLGWWTWMIVLVAFLAIAGEYFWDPRGSHDLTHGLMKDRLVLNLSMVNNPNALGHTVVPVIAMLYYFCIWRRPLFMQEIGLVTFVLPLACVFLTYSKGAYLAGAITLLATLTFGRPKAIQAIILSLALIGGVTALQTLPRMGELQKAKKDEAIQGRINAFRFGRAYFDTLTFGIGQGQFVDTLLREHHYYKAAHSTYVQTGTELGKIGLGLFLLVIWTNLRTLLFAKTHNVEQERIRRILFVLVVSYCVSGWMIDFAYRATFFMFSAAIGAFHRLLYRVQPEVIPSTDAAPAQPGWRTALEVPLVSAPVLFATSPAPLPAKLPFFRRGSDEISPAEKPAREWHRLGLFDLLATSVIWAATVWTWGYAIRKY